MVWIISHGTIDLEQDLNVKQLFGITIFMDLVAAEISSIRTILLIMVSLWCYRTFSVAKDWPAQISQTWLMYLPSMQNTPTGPIFKMMSTTKFFHIYKKNVESQLLEQSVHVGVATMPYGKILLNWRRSFLPVNSP